MSRQGVATWLLLLPSMLLGPLSVSADEPAMWGGYDHGNVPEVVQRSSPSIREHWSSLENSLRVSDDPQQRALVHVQRGEVLLSVHSRARAYKEFEAAGQLMLHAAHSESDLLQAVATFREMLASHRESFPLVPVGSPQLEPPFGAGYHAFWEGRLHEALEQFTSAIEWAPGEPLNYYYRALTYRRLGCQKEAVTDAESGAFWEFQTVRSHWPHNSRSRTSYISDRFERLQGPLRLWIEHYRFVRLRAEGATPQDLIDGQRWKLDRIEAPVSLRAITSEPSSVRAVYALRAEGSCDEM